MRKQAFDNFLSGVGLQEAITFIVRECVSLELIDSCKDGGTSYEAWWNGRLIEDIEHTGFQYRKHNRYYTHWRYFSVSLNECLNLWIENDIGCYTGTKFSVWWNGTLSRNLFNKNLRMKLWWEIALGYTKLSLSIVTDVAMSNIDVIPFILNKYIE